MNFRNLSISLLALGALAFAGCGGEDSTREVAAKPVETTPALSRADLITQGDAICAEVNAALGAAPAAAEASQEADIYTGMVQSIEGLGAPAETAGYSEFIEAAEELSKAEGEAKLVGERGDPAALESAQASVASALEAFRSAAADYGFQDCAEGPSAPTAPSSGSAGAAAEAPAAEAPAEAGVAPEEQVEEVAPETGGAGGEAAPEAAPTPETGGSSGGIGPG